MQIGGFQNKLVNSSGFRLFPSTSELSYKLLEKVWNVRNLLRKIHFCAWTKTFPYSFAVEDSYACKNLFEHKDLDEEKYRFWRKKIKRSTVFLVDYTDANIDFPWSKMLWLKSRWFQFVLPLVRKETLSYIQFTKFVVHFCFHKWTTLVKTYYK